MCQYCKVGVSILNSNMVTIGIKKTEYNNVIVKFLDTSGKMREAEFKIKYCPMCGEKL
ncbi:MAG: hypothetical protein ACRDD7_16330 [Peptostreptococcaceae bacterium]